MLRHGQNASLRDLMQLATAGSKARLVHTPTRGPQLMENLRSNAVQSDVYTGRILMVMLMLMNDEYC